MSELDEILRLATALIAADTGHPVFATLHTQTAAQSIDRIVDVFPPHQQGQRRSQLAAGLHAVVIQQLRRVWRPG